VIHEQLDKEESLQKEDRIRKNFERELVQRILPSDDGIRPADLSRVLDAHGVLKDFCEDGSVGMPAVNLSAVDAWRQSSDDRFASNGEKLLVVERKVARRWEEKEINEEEVQGGFHPLLKEKHIFRPSCFLRS
jgi:hypothetical protein